MKAIFKIHCSILVVLILLASPIMSLAQDIPDKPVPPRLVVDYAGVLTIHQVNSLENKLVAFDDTTSNQIAVVIVKSLNGYSKEDFADRLGEKWGIGRRGKDNGILILIKPKQPNSKGQVRISVGYGLEEYVPDAIGKRIIDHEMHPSFQREDYYTGLDEGTNILMALTTGAFTAEEYKASSRGSRLPLVGLLIIFVIVFILMRRNSSRHYSSGSQSLPLWTALWLGSTMGRRHGSGSSWQNFNSGSGGFGGGFGGFGGGGFGGGGAGGSW
jgi:uncharacterized protein